MDRHTSDFIQSIVCMLCVTAFVLSPAACTMNRQDRVAEAIKNGADPIAAKCSIESFALDSGAICLEYIKR